MSDSLVIALAICMLAAPLFGQNMNDPQVPKFPALDEKTIDDAIELTQANYFIYTHDKSAHTNGAYSGGKEFILAFAAWQGNEKADAELLKQFRTQLQGDNCIVAAGGYGSQHERIFTASAVLLRQTPRLWKQLTDAEKHKVDLLMKAGLVASAYTTSDKGNADSQNTDLMGGTNLSRGWNPNFREGMIGMMIVGTIWLGGAEQTYDFLDHYDHAKFTRQLRDAGLTNTAKTFGFAAANANSAAPKAAKIENDIADYEYMNTRLDDLMKIYHLLTLRTYGAKVHAGLNDGQGIKGSGKIAAGADGLPNNGKPGMLLEFDSVDGSGKRSSIGYAYTGFRPNLLNQIILIAGGQWKDGKMADECLALLRVGVPDLFYKLEHGYLDYSNGKARTEPVTINDEWRDFHLTRALWEQAIEPYHAAK